MNVTDSQIQTIQILWSRVCKDRGWKSSDKEFRLANFSEIVGRPLTSTKEIGRIDECTKLMKSLKAMLGIDLKAARESDDLTINQARVWRNQIVSELVPCLELYIADVAGYMASIMEDKNRWWKIDRPARGMTLMDLDAKPTFRTDRRTSQTVEMPSQLKQMQFTLAARLNTLRNEAGDTVHDMRTKARLNCTCALCRGVRVVTSAPEISDAVDPELGETVEVGIEAENGTPF